MNRQASLHFARRSAIAAAIAASFAAPMAQAADPGQPLGAAIDISSSLATGQQNPVIARNASGAMVVAWEGFLESAQNYAIFGQRLDAAGVPQGAAFVVNGNTSEFDQQPAVAINDDGDFTVAWLDIRGNQVYARRFAADGTPQSDDLGMVERYSIGLHVGSPSVAMDDDGDFTVAWVQQNHLGGNSYLCGYSPIACLSADGASVRARRYGAGGTRAGLVQTVDVAADIRVFEAEVGSLEDHPSLAMAHDGSFMIAWDRLGNGPLSGVYVRRYDALGLPGLPQRVAGSNGGDVALPKAATDGSRRYAVAYRQPDGIYARPYGPLGLPSGKAQLVEDAPSPGDSHPSIAMDAAGDFVVAWPFKAQRFASSGGKRGANFDVDSSGGGSPTVASDAAGNFAFAWGDNGQIKLRLFAGP